MFIKSKYYKNAEIQLNFNQCLSLIINVHTVLYSLFRIKRTITKKDNVFSNNKGS